MLASNTALTLRPCLYGKVSSVLEFIGRYRTLLQHKNYVYIQRMESISFDYFSPKQSFPLYMCMFIYLFYRK